MKVILRCTLFMLLAISSSFAQQHTAIKKDQMEGTENDGARDEWIRNMHRAAPGVRWQQTDAATREAKYQALVASRHRESTLTMLSVPQDTIANGRLVGYWAERGSNNICGRMHTADIDFDHNTIYAASAMGNIWEAPLANTSQWTSLNDQHRFGEVRMLRVVTTSTGKRIIAMANEPAMVYFPNVPAMVYYSDDYGTTWQNATGLNAPNNAGGFKRGVMTADDQTMYILADEWNNTTSGYWTSIYRSTNQGKNFTNLGKWNYDVTKCDIWTSRDYPSSLFFLKGDSLFRLSGSIFSFIHVLTYSTDVSAVGSILLQGTVRNNSVNLATLETTNAIGTITISSDAGLTWSRTGTFSGSPFNANSFKMLPSNPTTLAIGAINAYVSRNSGATWTPINDWSEYYTDSVTKLHADIDGIDFIQDPTGAETQIFSTDGGMFKSTDALHTFTNITLSGIRSSQYYSTLTSGTATPYIFGGSQDQGFQSVQDGSGILQMYQKLSGDYGHVTSSNTGSSVWTVYPGFIYGQALFYPTAQTSDYNTTWSFQGSNFLWMPPIVADPADPHSAYIASGGSSSESFIWHLSSGGNSASHLSYDFSGGNTNRNISALAFSPLNGANMYVLTNDGEFFVSTNTGSSWTQSGSSGPSGQSFYGSAILPSVKNQNTLWIGGSGYSNPGVYQSTDNGATFTAMNSGLPSTLVTCLAATDDEKYLFAATDVGPYIYSFADGNWYPMENGHAPDMVYWSVEYIPALKTARFGSYGRGILDFTLGQAPMKRNYSITAPKTGEIILAGTSNYTIQYSATNPGLQQTFQYSSDGGASWTPITGTQDSSSFTWSQIPNLSTTHGLISMTDEFGTRGTSGPFIIKKGSMSITTPKAGETIIGGTSDYLIEYTAQIAGKQKKFEFSSDQGSTWTIITGTDSTSVYTWSQVPNIATSKGLIRISDELGVFAVSGLFTIIKKVGPSISQVSVNGVAGLQIASGISTTITWLSSGNLGHYLAAEYSPDNSHWTIIDSMITTSENSIPWITPAPSPAMYVRVRSIDSMTISGTYGPFAIDLIAGVRVDENLTVNAISNYPNPVSSTTTFSYYMVKSGPIRLCVYDLIGREVACIVDTKMKDPGLYTADFNASKLVNGSYTYVLTTGSNTVSGTMVVFK